MLSKTSQLRFFPGMLLLLILLALLTGCGGSPGESPGNSLRIAVIPKGTTHDFWKMVHAGAIKAERDQFLRSAEGRNYLEGTAQRRQYRAADQPGPDLRLPQGGWHRAGAAGQNGPGAPGS